MMHRFTKVVLTCAALSLIGATCRGAAESDDESAAAAERQAPTGSPVTREDSVRSPMFRAWNLASFGPAADVGDDVTVVELEAALASLPADRGVTLDLTEEGRAAGFAGCNRYFGDFRVEEGDRIVQGPKGATLMACPGVGLKIEQAFLRNLDASVRAVLREGKLELETDAGVVLVFTAAE